MSTQTTNFNMVLPAQTDGYNIETLNGNFGIIDTEMAKPPLTVNGKSPAGSDRDIEIDTVPFAENLATDIPQRVTGAFVQRTTGGDASVGNGKATLSVLKGYISRVGYVPEEININVTSADEENPLEYTFDRDTFVAYVEQSGITTLTYTTAWSEDPSLYGITVTNTPTNGDSITIAYVKESRGVIYNPNPTAFNSTGWNLYNNASGRARVIKYSNYYGFRVDGEYTALTFAETVSGAQTPIVVTDHHFSIPSSGFVFVEGGDATTSIYATWSDWTEGYAGEFEPYTLDTIDLTEVMLAFPYGLLAVGDIRDEIDLSAGVTINRVQRIDYTAQNLAEVKESGLAYIADTNYIFVELETPVTASITIDDEFNVNDHGIEFFSTTTTPVLSEILYPENLKDKLRQDVLTISEQDLTADQKQQVRNNIGAAGAAELALKLDNNAPLFFSKQYKTTSTVSVNSNAEKTLTYGNFGITPIDGYTPVAITSFSGKAGILLRRWDKLDNSAESGTTIIAIRNVTGSTISSFNPTITLLYVKSSLVTTEPEAG